MAKGFEVELSNGAILKVVPNAGIDNCIVIHGDSRIEIDVKNTSFRIIPAGKSVTAIPAVVRFGVKELTVTNNVASVAVNDTQQIVQACQSCNGDTCCAYDCCCDCGCGWFCG
jgi:hypothetical protein